jgi:hypothetical protein
MLASTGQIVSNANQLCHLCNYVTLKGAALSHALGTILTDEPIPNPASFQHVCFGY